MVFEFSGHLLVLGLGTSGEAVAEWALRRAAGGSQVLVSVVDSSRDSRLEARASRLREMGADVRLGTEALPSADLVVASPGIRPQSGLMAAALSLGVPIISEVELAYRISAAPWIAVTGTNGKTTTTALVTHLLRESGIPAEPAGNFGPAAVTVAENVGAAGVIVAEISSFQMVHAQEFHPRVAVLLNITPDHIDYHGSMEAYSAEKGKVFANQVPGDTAVVDVDDPGSAAYADVAARRGATVRRVSRFTMPEGGAYLRGGALVLDDNGSEQVLVRVDELGLRGDHNVSNALAAAACARAAGADLDALRRGLKSFSPIEHRLEPAGVVHGVEYFNDSKATNPDAVVKALTAFGERSLIVLLGGRNKGVDMRSLAESVSARARAVVLFGEAASELAEVFSESSAEVVVTGGMTDAFNAARDLARAGEVVLLSPGCTSFDEFTGYEQRGERFKELVSSAGAGDRADGA
ncbi:MAG: UDP-N-acetylmuramoyl-L-alanine--D-glutamate ligase [Coriobacteriia bacterium]|nr:UDP-N-acetylmuramoyl-L-alanine--D-glutamate ligase [Coriobacteriia bacterium]